MNQDWEPVVLRKHKTKKELNAANKSTQKVPKDTKPNSNSNSNQQLSKKLKNDFDPEAIVGQTLSTRELSNAIQQGRASKQITQTDLDKACMFPKNTTRDYENCSIQVNSEQINKMERVLGVKLPRPNKSKPKE